MGKIYIGTSGWHYPSWIGPFYPPGMPPNEFLPYYARRLSTVEINNTFYHLPTPHTLREWEKHTPKNFLFACKASRFITHMKMLKDPEKSIERFFPRLEEFLKALPATFRYAFEFRDKSWFAQPVYDVLSKYGAAFCLYHLAGQWSPEIITTDYVYIRLHGPGEAYQGKYHGHTLRAWANKCSTWAQSGKDVYCYFDNDEQGFAPINALALNNLIYD
jgi:uncharacterized protein YecE (DUF72 family)